MKERPILFSTLMVQALLAGNKTQTRRSIKSINNLTNEHFCFTLREVNPEFGYAVFDGLLPTGEICPYGKLGDILWVRETWAKGRLVDEDEKEVYNGWLYRANADFEDDPELSPGFKWHPSIHMRKEACRIKLQITNIRVERVQDISSLDAIAEGCKYTHEYPELWESINGIDLWSSNPWVWCITFKKL